MKQIINGKMYDTDSSLLVCSLDSGWLYRTKHGAYFLYVEYDAEGGQSIVPVHSTYAFNWLQKHDQDDVSKREFPYFYNLECEQEIEK